jgi:uncharacterized coiled-coil protein SlyX
MPSILEVSRELLKRSRRPSAGESPARLDVPPASALEARISALEENERRQAELVTSMADQLAQLTTAVTALHGQMRLLIFGQVAAAVVAVIALVLALR